MKLRVLIKWFGIDSLVPNFFVLGKVSWLRYFEYLLIAIFFEIGLGYSVLLLAFCLVIGIGFQLPIFIDLYWGKVFYEIFVQRCDTFLLLAHLFGESFHSSWIEHNILLIFKIANSSSTLCYVYGNQGLQNWGLNQDIKKGLYNRLGKNNVLCMWTRIILTIALSPLSFKDKGHYRPNIKVASCLCSLNIGATDVEDTSKAKVLVYLTSESLVTYDLKDEM